MPLKAPERTTEEMVRLTLVALLTTVGAPLVLILRVGALSEQVVPITLGLFAVRTTLVLPTSTPAPGSDGALT